VRDENQPQKPTNTFKHERLDSDTAKKQGEYRPCFHLVSLLWSDSYIYFCSFLEISKAAFFCCQISLFLLFSSLISQSSFLLLSIPLLEYPYNHFQQVKAFTSVPRCFSERAAKNII